MSPPIVAVAALCIVMAAMLAETALSRRHESQLRVLGAVEPPGDVYRAMQIAYPGAFVVMALEGALAGPPAGAHTWAGIAVFGLAKALKYWAIGSLGTRWTFRVLVPPGATSVTSGPYAWVRHPNYVAVIGELVGMALIVGARLTGPLATLVFAALIGLRLRVEERALRHPPCT